ncbi:hypothetical protein M3C52_006100 [Micrococcus luteus]|nr:hypothetical protein [Micrococcus luteus]
MLDDRVQRQFAAEAPNRLWITGTTEHPTDECKLPLHTIKDAHTERIVHSDCGSQSVFQDALTGHGLIGSMDHVGAAEDNVTTEPFNAR